MPLHRNTDTPAGELAQLAERVLSMHEVWGSIPQFSIYFLDHVIISNFCWI